MSAPGPPSDVNKGKLIRRCCDCNDAHRNGNPRLGVNIDRSAIVTGLGTGAGSEIWIIEDKDHAYAAENDTCR